MVSLFSRKEDVEFIFSSAEASRLIKDKTDDFEIQLIILHRDLRSILIDQRKLLRTKS
jgi:hypothetical protein